MKVFLKNPAFLILVLSFATLVACSKRSGSSSTRPVPRNPPSVPTTPGDNIDNSVVRSAMPVVQFEASVLEALRSQGFYDPDNCVRWVKMTQGGNEIGQYLEIAATACPGSETGLLEDRDVLLRLSVKKDAQSPHLFPLVYEQSYSPEVGILRKDASGKIWLDGLCDINPRGYSREWDMYCYVRIENSLFASPNPLEFFNLD